VDIATVMTLSPLGPRWRGISRPICSRSPPSGTRFDQVTELTPGSTRSAARTSCRKRAVLDGSPPCADGAATSAMAMPCVRKPGSKSSARRAAQEQTGAREQNDGDRHLRHDQGRPAPRADAARKPRVAAHHAQRSAPHRAHRGQEPEPQRAHQRQGGFSRQRRGAKDAPVAVSDQLSFDVSKRIAALHQSAAPALDEIAQCIAELGGFRRR
jgi:hypothetical protein